MSRLDEQFNRRRLLKAGAGAALSAYGLGALSGCTVSREIDRSAEGQSSSRRSTATS